MNTAGTILSRLKRDILSGAFVPGEKLKMSCLKERYEAGIGPLREALSQLVAEKLVSVEDQRGFRVSSVSKEQMGDIYNARTKIEALCVSEAIEKGNDEWEADIVAASYRLKKMGSPSSCIENIEQWEQVHQQFHSAIICGCQSPALLQVRHSLYEKVTWYRNLWLKNNMINLKVFDANQKEHEMLVKVLLSRDKNAAVQLIKQHFQAAYRLLLLSF